MNPEKNPTTGAILDVFGPTVEYLVSPSDESSDFCVMKGIIPPGVFVPMHRHPDTEDFFILSGTAECLKITENGHEWVPSKEGDLIHIPSNATHAWRNTSSGNVTFLITTTKKMGHFFEETALPWKGVPQMPTPEALAHLLEVSERYGYWNASPEENAAVGINMSFS
ncbi:cupin domain-containing protein [Ktedonobacter racemifer]|uniref:Cupin 2 conserved barrel domain protein n=1 Tax=Ktedonobacter racemifer DSM 44963 TaxID=485913 RepID=D6TK78_KTERA|nr:cupin domain-containing protein [Ktedonobacter racemifer]EFH86178.1 Cupin 2 conserved barrel domain protein [Ktedonobacter racemifer DSM 44963]